MPEYDEETKAKISGNNIGSNTCSSFIQRIKKQKPSEGRLGNFH